MDLQHILLKAHGGFAYLELLLIAIFAVLVLMTLLTKGGQISSFLKKITLFVMILFHIQFLTGIVMLFVTSPFLDNMDQLGMGGLMKNPALRFSYIEHPTSMLIAAVLMTIVNKKVKHAEKLTGGATIMAVIALALFFFAFPFAKVFGA